MTPAEITAARKALGMTQGQLAEALGVHINAVSRWENGRRKMARHTAAHLQRILDEHEQAQEKRK